jgi:anti-sigma B factor antagonist
MQVNTRQLGSATVFDLDGRLVYGEQCDFLRVRVKEELAQGNKQLVVNLANVPTVDSGGIGTIVAVYTSARSAGGGLKIAAANDKVYRSLTLTHIMTVVEHFPNADSAAASFEDATQATA